MLNEIETEIVKKTMERTGVAATCNIKVEDLSTIYIPQGNFTICILMHCSEIITAGVAKRNPKDHFKAEDRAVIGCKRSLNEAVKNLFERRK